MKYSDEWIVLIENDVCSSLSSILFFVLLLRSFFFRFSIKRRSILSIDCCRFLMAINQHRTSKTITKFFTRFFWHFEQQPVPNYSQINRYRSHSASTKKMAKKNISTSMILPTTVDVNHLKTLNCPRQRHSSFREATSSLDTITEE